ncbi:MAG: diadenylate cyclase [Lentisphaeria bacterium]|nr:diadenylate cyclase [Lentisphaeria bacterium]
MTEDYQHIIKAILQIGILAFLFYMVLKALRRTRGLTLLGAVFAFLAIMQVLSSVFDLAVLRWLLERMISILPLFVLVTFQDEMRRVVAALVLDQDHSAGSEHTTAQQKESRQARILSDIVMRLADSRTGALIAVERKISLAEFKGVGRPINAPLEDNLLLDTIFYSGSPLHDGGVIINDGVVEVAACVFPLCKNQEVVRKHGMRHQAAIGLSEHTDAVVIVVSEETGGVSLVVNGQLQKMVSPEQFRQQLNRYLVTSSANSSRWWWNRIQNWSQSWKSEKSAAAAVPAAVPRDAASADAAQAQAADDPAKLNVEV